MYKLHNLTTLDNEIIYNCPPHVIITLLPSGLLVSLARYTFIPLSKQIAAPLAEYRPMIINYLHNTRFPTPVPTTTPTIAPTLSYTEKLALKTGK